jgi:hypothetical protein
LELPREDYTQTKLARKYPCLFVVLFIQRPWASVHAASADLVDNPNFQIAADADLARKTHIRGKLRLNRQTIPLEVAHRPRLAFKNLNPARRATCISTTTVKNIDTCVFKYEYQFLPIRCISLDWPSGRFSVDLWHL